MTYITLDLEWNQAYAQKALAVQKQLSCRLRGEVIQIGAVKLDKNLKPCGSYQVIVKPKFYKKLHRHVSALTGITQEQMDMGISLTEAAQRFKKWCGKDFAFLTWGPDDVPMLRENFHAHGIEHSWLDSVYDLQRIYATEVEQSSKQRSLEYVMEYFGIPQNLPAHDALNDAYFTALVAERLDVDGGVKRYNENRGEYLSDSVIGDADAGDDGYVTINEMLDDDMVKAPDCPICGKPLSQKGKTLHSKGQRYTFYFECKNDGDIFEILKLHKNFNDTWRARRMMKPASPEEVEEYKKGLERSNIRRKIYRGKSRGRKSMPKGE
ncbi:MAG: exonuclease domain-containing protein [Clostridia bacterium]|nr:exonuclease domain-containing protein [Clostridia bacterium]